MGCCDSKDTTHHYDDEEEGEGDHVAVVPPSPNRVPRITARAVAPQPLPEKSDPPSDSSTGTPGTETVPNPLQPPLEKPSDSTGSFFHSLNELETDEDRPPMTITDEDPLVGHSVGKTRHVVVASEPVSSSGLSVPPTEDDPKALSFSTSLTVSPPTDSISITEGSVVSDPGLGLPPGFASATTDDLPSFMGSISTGSAVGTSTVSDPSLTQHPEGVSVTTFGGSPAVDSSSPQSASKSSLSVCWSTAGGSSTASDPTRAAGSTTTSSSDDRPGPTDTAVAASEVVVEESTMGCSSD